MNINIKLCHPEAKIPTKAHETDACFDLTAVTYRSPIDFDYSVVEYDTGIAFEIPQGYCGLVYPRSSVSNKGLLMANSVGVIDAPYRGTVKVRFYSTCSDMYEPGDRIAQIMFVPVKPVTLDVVQELSTTKRGAGAYGSTGVK